jgi:hypothetical protein
VGADVARGAMEAALLGADTTPDERAGAAPRAWQMSHSPRHTMRFFQLINKGSK